jgi:hypothetical protein
MYKHGDDKYQRDIRKLGISSSTTRVQYRSKKNQINLMTEGLRALQKASALARGPARRVKTKRTPVLALVFLYYVFGFS